MNPVLTEDMQDKLRLEFNTFVIRLSKGLTERAWQQLKTLWTGILPQQKLECPEMLITSLLEREHVTLTDISCLKKQLEDPLQEEQLVTICKEYELKIRTILQGHSDSSPDLNNLHIGPEAHSMQDPATLCSIAEPATTVPVQEKSLCTLTHHSMPDQATLSSIAQSVTRVPVQEVSLCPVMHVVALPGEVQYDPSCHTSHELMVSSIPSYLGSMSTDPVESEDCHSFPRTSSQGTKAEIHVAPPFSAQLPSPHHLPETTSGDSPSRLDKNLKNGSQQHVHPELMPHHQVTMPGETLWSEDTLKKFESLEDFQTEEIQNLHQVLKNIDVVVEEPFLLRVSAFFCRYQTYPSAKQGLRRLAECLKVLKRHDVVEAMHCEDSLLKDLGPKQEDKLCIKNMKFKDRHEFTVAFSVEQPEGKDWRYLADKLKIGTHYIQNWRQRQENPAEELLRSWETKVTKATVGTLFDYLMEMGREDLAAML